MFSALRNTTHNNLVCAVTLGAAMFSAVTLCTVMFSAVTLGAVTGPNISIVPRTFLPGTHCGGDSNALSSIALHFFTFQIQKYKHTKL